MKINPEMLEIIADECNVKRVIIRSIDSTIEVTASEGNKGKIRYVEDGKGNLVGYEWDKEQGLTLLYKESA